MRERPILFSAPMVRAILRGRKTQTRRMIKPRKGLTLNDLIAGGEQTPHASGTTYSATREMLAKDCPYGVPGDRLWVKETHAIVPRSAYAMSDGVHRTLRPDDSHDAAVYAADWERSKPGRWRPSIHMPRWASRITLEITGVRAERLNECSAADAAAEGLIKLPASGRYVVEQGDQYFGAASHDPREVYAWLWEHINGAGSWAANPWVWVVEFKRIEADRG